jgi:hypothetical protein
MRCGRPPQQRTGRQAHRPPRSLESTTRYASKHSRHAARSCSEARRAVPAAGRLAPAPRRLRKRRTLRANAAWPVSAPTLCLCKTPGQEGLGRADSPPTGTGSTSARISAPARAGRETARWLDSSPRRFSVSAALDCHHRDERAVARRPARGSGADVPDAELRAFRARFLVGEHAADLGSEAELTRRDLRPAAHDIDGVGAERGAVAPDADALDQPD